MDKRRRGLVLQGSFRPLQPSHGVATTRVPAGQLRTIGEGRPLDPGLRQAAERFFQADFSSVRIHVGSAAPALGALAFALGDQLHFAPGMYDPTTRQGVALLGHELTHVVQQRDGRVANPYGAGIAIVQDPALEQEADQQGQRLADALWSLPRTPAMQPAIAQPGGPARAQRSAPRRAAPGPPSRAVASSAQAAWIRNLFGGGANNNNNPWGALAGLGNAQNPQNQQPVWVAWDQLFQNPTALLGQGDLVASQHFPPPVHANQVGTALIPTVNTYQCTAQSRRSVRLRQDVNGHAFDVRLNAGMNTRWAFYLPWSQNAAECVQLNQQVDVFVTDPLNGCGILIAGTTLAPTVIHANHYIGVADLPAWRHFYTNAYVRRYLNQQRENAYDALALQLGLNNHYLYSPTEYYAFGRARVFGLRDQHRGNWRFYAIDETTGQRATRRIWP